MITKNVLLAEIAEALNNYQQAGDRAQEVIATIQNKHIPPVINIYINDFSNESRFDYCGELVK